MAKFHVGDKVKFVVRNITNPEIKWVQESINTKPLTITKVYQTGYDTTYYVLELPYSYSECWLEPIEEVAQKPKFKIGDIVVRDTEVARLIGANSIPAKITDILEIHSHGTKKFSYRYVLENNMYEYDEDELKLADKDDILVRSLEICSNSVSCKGCHYYDISDGCDDKLEKDAAECIKRLKAKIKELEKND